MKTNLSECPEAYSRWYCLNGATCFALKIQDSTLYNCWCTSGYHGLRCDYKYVTHRFHEENNDKLASSTPSLSSSTTSAEVASQDNYNQLSTILTLRQSDKSGKFGTREHSRLGSSHLYSCRWSHCLT